MWKEILLKKSYFNSQPHKEADTIRTLMERRFTHFNSQPHKEADGISGNVDMDVFYISTHSLTRRLTLSLPYRMQLCKHFNSQPHKEADYTISAANTNIYVISTHSLTRRLTKSYLNSQMPGTFQLTASQGG